MAFSECNTFHHIDVQFRQGVAHLLLSNTNKRNALSREMLSSISVFLKSTANDTSFRALVIRGQGGFFSSGADLEWMQQGALQTVKENIADANLFFDTFYLLNNYPKPVVAVVEKAAYGGAIGLLACADVVLATSDALFAFSEVKLGLVPATIAPFVMQKIGQSAMRRYMLTAQRFDVQQAKSMGLVHHIINYADLNEQLNILLNDLMKNGPESMATTKQLVNRLSGVHLSATALRGEVSQIIASARASAEGREGVAAFLEKRAAGWTPFSRNDFETVNE
jgi:methylglutaconyl-CoA hydratase